MKRALAALLVASFVTGASGNPVPSAADPSAGVKEPSRPQIIRPTIELMRIAEPSKMPGATEPDLAIDPADPAHWVVGAIMGGVKGGALVSYPVFASSDGGRTWARGEGLPPSHAGDPGVEFDLDGAVYLSTLDPTVGDGTPVGVTVARSTDGGRTFAQVGYAMDTSTSFIFPDGVARKLCDGEGSFFDFPKLAVDRSSVSPYKNHLYLVANGINFDRDGDGTCESASHVFIRSVDGGRHWDAGQSIPGMKQYTSSLAVGADGAVYLADPTLGTPFCAGASGVALRKSIDGGASFQPATCVPAPGLKLSGDPTWSAADPRDPGKVYVAFSATLPGPKGTHIFVARSADGGESWSEPVRVDDVLARDEVDHLRPSLSVSENGRLDLAWADYRNSKSRRFAESRQAGDVYYAYSLDGGATWARNMRLTGPTAPLLYVAGNDSLSIVSSGEKALAVFAQDRDGNILYEAYLAVIAFR